MNLYGYQKRVPIEHVWAIIGKIKSCSYLHPSKLNCFSKSVTRVYKKVFVFKTFLKKELIVSIFSTELSTVCFLPFQFSYFCIPTVQILSIFKNVIHTKENM